MRFEGIEVCCPACHGELHEDGIAERMLHCLACDRTFPVLVGIPDLRVADDPYIDRVADRDKALRIAERLADTDLAGLIAQYYAMTPAVPPADALRYTRGLLASEARARANLAAWEAALGTPLRGERMLDLGCGTAPLLVAAADRFQLPVGVDIAFRWLVVAKKRLEAAGIAAPLICACAEALPFPEEQFDLVAGESALETVTDQERTLAEVRRTLRGGGQLALSTPNRFSLGPDPHVGLWAGGFLPDRAIAAYVRWRGGVPPRRKLLSAIGLRRALREAGFAAPRVLLPTIPDAQLRAAPPFQARLLRLYNRLMRLPVSRHLLFAIGPVLHGVASRNPEPAGRPGRRRQAAADASPSSEPVRP